MKKSHERVLLPQKDKVFKLLEELWFLLFPDHLRPRHFVKDRISEKEIKEVFKKVKKDLWVQIERAFESQKKDKKQARDVVEIFLKKLPTIKEKLLLDAQAARDRDPAVENLDEVIFCYPGFLALMTYRLSHELASQKVPIIPRLMSEMAHSMTGCDIHPEAQIGEALFIDHGTGVVIGQTSVIGNRVTIFQGVTLGAIAMQQEKVSSAKRHPTIEDDVVIYSNATILGGQTTIGRRSIIGGSCWITFSVPPDSKIILANPRSLLAESQKKIEYIPNWEI